MSFSSLVAINQLSVVFDEKKILDDISFSVKTNHIHTLIGPNGAGKSTLVKCILGLIKPTSGNIVYAANLHIGYVPQKLKINESLPLTVLHFLSLRRQTTKNEIDEALNMVAAFHLRHASMHNLSGGEMQRVLLANAMLKKPNLLVLDEPVQGVDVNGQLALYALIVALKEKLGCAVLMVSHDLHLVMAKTDEVICLHHHICCQGTPKLISSHPEYLARFGNKAEEMLALYQHKHNHEHDLAGEPVIDCKQHGGKHG